MDFGSFIEAGSSAVLNEILASTHDDNGMALPSKYEVLFLPPSGTRGTGGPAASTNLFSQVLLGQVGGQDVKDVSYQCNSIEFPPRTIDIAADENIYGPARKIAQGYTYGDITGKFYCHNDMREKKFFETWQRLSFNPQTFAMGYYDDYIGSVDIHTMDEQNKKRYGVKLVECFPKSIGAQQLSYAGTGYLTCAVTFSYRYWKNLTDEADLPKPLLDRIAERAVNTVTRRITSQIPSVLRRL